jgi:hypothetical protein
MMEGSFHSALRKLKTKPSMVLPTKSRFTWPSGFREEYFLEINQTETRISCGAMLVNGSEINEQSL